MSIVRIALWGPLLVAAVIAGAYIYMHDPFASDGTELLPVPLSEQDPDRDRFGDLHYRGGLDIPRMGQNIGGLSGLRWDADSGRLLAITDDARWVWITLEETEGQLVGLAQIDSGPLLGVNGEVLTGKEHGDSESLTRSADGGWLVGFERDDRVLHYPELSEPAQPARVEPASVLGPFEENRGLETLAGDEDSLFACAERAPEPDRVNCLWARNGPELEPYALETVAAVAWNGAVPTDADRTAEGSIFVLFRSYSPDQGNWVGISELRLDGTRVDQLVLDPIHATVDNFEGIALREEQGRTFLYIVSDDNFSGAQRTLLMKFELLPGQGD
jgi:hypothetical protein